MKNKKNSLFLIVLLILFSSCEKETQLSIPSQEPRLLVTSFISPQDTVVSIKVSMTTPLYTSFKNIITDSVQRSQVVLSDGNQEQLIPLQSFKIQANSQDNFAIFQAKPSFTIQNGGTYYLKVTSPNGKIANASCTIPTPPSTIKKPAISPSEVRNKDQYTNGFLVEWETAPGYYYITNPLYIIFILKDNSSTIYQSGIGTDFKKYFEVDQSNKAQLQFIFNQYKSNDPFNYNLLTYQIFLIDQPYFLYHVSIEKQEKYQSQAPFAEPVSLYSNIEGGLGIFAGYTTIYEQ